MSGGKGGSQTTSVKIPQWLEDAAKQNMARADEIAQIGYVPYFGPDVAAFTPMQQAAMQNTNNAAAAFGMAAPADAMAGMPAPQTFAGGVQGYSSAPMYQQSLAQLQAAAPGQYAALNAPFINPVTGADPAAPFGAATSAPAVTRTAAPVATRSGSSDSSRSPATMRSSGGFTSVRDMFDGGGAGASGSTFSGGPMSGALNTIGVKPVSSGGSRSSGMGGGK